MRIRVINADQGGCGFYRCKAPVDAVKKAYPEHDVKLFSQADYSAPAPDVLVWQRPMTSDALATIPRMQDMGTRVVIEIDDRMDAIDPMNPAFAACSPSSSTPWSWVTLAKACGLADHVVVSSDALAAHYAPHGRVSVVRNTVPTSYLDHQVDQHTEAITVGYGGSLAFHPRDMEACGHGVANALMHTGASFLGLGDPGLAPALFIDPACATYQPPVHIDLWPMHMARMHVSLVPLADTAFNRSKSWLKAVESAAVGAVPVMTPLPEQVRLHDEFGIGLLASSPKDWQRVVKRLCVDHDYRRELSAHGREVVASSLTVDRVASEWMSAWSGHAV